MRKIRQFLSFQKRPKLSNAVEEDLIAENQQLHAEIDHLKNLQALVLERATSGEKAPVVQKLRPKLSLSLLLKIAQLPRATFYYHLKRMQQADKYAGAKEEIGAIYHENKTIQMGEHNEQTL